MCSSSKAGPWKLCRIGVLNRRARMAGSCLLPRSSCSCISTDARGVIELLDQLQAGYFNSVALNLARHFHFQVVFLFRCLYGGQGFAAARLIELQELVVVGEDAITALLASGHERAFTGVGLGDDHAAFQARARDDAH